MRVLVADDSELIRRCIMQVLAAVPQIEVCGEARDSSEAVAKAQELRPDLVLLDISMPGVGGLKASRLIRQVLPETKVLVITHNDASMMLPAARDYGAEGCIDKARLGTELLPAITILERKSTEPDHRLPGA